MPSNYSIYANECLEINKIKIKYEWPDYDERYFKRTILNIVIQINGKKRGIF